MIHGLESSGQALGRASGSVLGQDFDKKQGLPVTKSVGLRYYIEVSLL
jgi:hypothetical protein